MKNINTKQKQALYSNTSLVIVHAYDASCCDIDSVSKNQIQYLIDNLQNPSYELNKRSENIFEFMTKHQSFVNHDGKIIDNYDSPGDFHLPNPAFEQYILVGGQLGQCHFSAYLSLIAQRHRRKTTVHLPADAIYIQGKSYDSGDTDIVSDLTKITQKEYGMYKDILKALPRSVGHEIYHDKEKIDEIGAKNLTLRLWSKSDLMLENLVARYVS